MLESLGAGDRRAGARQGGRGGPDADLGHAPPEVARGQAGREARGPAGGQRVVRAGHVVAERRAGLDADEQAAGAAHARRQRLGGGARQLQVLGRERLRERQRRLHVGGQHSGAGQRVEQRGVVAHGDGQRAGPVLGLGQEVEPQRRGVRVAGGDHGQVAGPCEAVDPHGAPRPGAWPPAPRGCRGRR